MRFAVNGARGLRVATIGSSAIRSDISVLGEFGVAGGACCCLGARACASPFFAPRNSSCYFELRVLIAVIWGSGGYVLTFQSLGILAAIWELWG